MKLAPVLGVFAAVLASAGVANADAQSLSSNDKAGYTADVGHNINGVPLPDRNDVITWKLVTNGPVPDTPANRALYEPLSNAGRHTTPAAN